MEGSRQRHLEAACKKIDLHVFVVPASAWRADLRYADSSTYAESASAGFVRVDPEATLVDLRADIAKQLDVSLLPHTYVFLRSVGRCLTWIAPRQEIFLRNDLFVPPLATSPEIYLLDRNFLCDHYRIPSRYYDHTRPKQRISECCAELYFTGPKAEKLRRRKLTVPPIRHRFPEEEGYPHHSTMSLPLSFKITSSDKVTISCMDNVLECEVGVARASSPECSSGYSRHSTSNSFYEGVLTPQPSVNISEEFDALTDPNQTGHLPQGGRLNEEPLSGIVPRNSLTQRWQLQKQVAVSTPHRKNSAEAVDPPDMTAGDVLQKETYSTVSLPPEQQDSADSLQKTVNLSPTPRVLSKREGPPLPPNTLDRVVPKKTTGPMVPAITTDLQEPDYSSSSINVGHSSGAVQKFHNKGSRKEHPTQILLNNKSPLPSIVETQSLSNTPGTQPLTNTPRTQPLTNTPGTQPLTNTPGTQPLANTPRTQPLTNTPWTQPLTNTPGTQPLTNTPRTQPLTNTPGTQTLLTPLLSSIAICDGPIADSTQSRDILQSLLSPEHLKVGLTCAIPAMSTTGTTGTTGTHGAHTSAHSLLVANNEKTSHSDTCCTSKGDTCSEGDSHDVHTCSEGDGHDVHTCSEGDGHDVHTCSEGDGHVHTCSEGDCQRNSKLVTSPGLGSQHFVGNGFSMPTSRKIFNRLLSSTAKEVHTEPPRAPFKPAPWDNTEPDGIAWVQLTSVEQPGIKKHEAVLQQPVSGSHAEAMDNLRIVKQECEELDAMRSKMAMDMKHLQSLLKRKRDESDEEWKRNFLAEKKRFRSLEEKVKQLRGRVYALRKATEEEVQRSTANGMMQDSAVHMPSEQSNIQIQCRRLKAHIQQLRQRLDSVKDKVFTEQQVHQALLLECKILRDELVAKKIACSKARI